MRISSKVKLLLVFTALFVTQINALKKDAAQCRDKIHEDLRSIPGWNKLIHKNPTLSKNSNVLCNSLEGVPNCCN